MILSHFEDRCSIYIFQLNRNRHNPNHHALSIVLKTSVQYMYTQAYMIHSKIFIQ